jgi:hypothetical protein
MHFLAQLLVPVAPIEAALLGSALLVIVVGIPLTFSVPNLPSERSGDHVDPWHERPRRGQSVGSRSPSSVLPVGIQQSFHIWDPD